MIKKLKKKLFAINKQTGEPWKPNTKMYEHHYLVICDTGVVSEVCTNWGGYSLVSPLDKDAWEFIYDFN